MKSLVIFENGIDPRKAGGDSVVLAMNKKIQNGLGAMGIKFMKPDDYMGKGDYTDIFSHESMELVRKWGKIKAGGKNLGNLLTCNGIPYWDSIAMNFATHLFQFSEKLQTIKLIKKAIESEKPDFVVAEDGTLSGETTFYVAKSMGIKTNVRPKKLPRLKKGMHLTVVKNIARVMDRKRRMTSPKITYPPKSGAGRILVIPTIETETPIISPVIKELERIGYEVITLRLGSISERMERSLGLAGIKSIPVESFEDRDARKRYGEAIRYLKNEWSGLRKNREFTGSIKYLEIPVWNFVREDFEFYFSSRERIAEVAKYAEIMRGILDRVKPDLILTLDELSETGKPMSIMAKNRRIPVVVVQHGIYGKWYLIEGPSLATKKCIWGPYTKKLLLQKGFKEGQLVVTGCPRFDSVFRSKYDREKTLSGLGLDPEKETVLFAAPAILKEMTERILDELVKLIQKNPGIQLILKLHPRQRWDDHFRKRLSGVKNAAVTRESDIFEMINASGIVFIVSSTTGLEALMMDKPLVTFHYERSTDYAEKGLALEVDDYGRIQEAVMNFLRDRKLRERFMKNRRKYVKDQVYKTDGRATERVVREIEKILK